LAGAFLSIASLTSALTRNQVVAFILAVMISLLLILCGWRPITDPLSAWAPAWLVDAVTAVGVMTHFDSVQRGVVDSRDLLFFISVIVFSLFTTSVILRAHRA
jgi:ABC-2 type transport system permease protein